MHKRVAIKQWQNPRLVVPVILLLLLFFVAGIFARRGFFDSEIALLRWVYAWPHWLLSAFFVITQFGSGWALIVSCAVVVWKRSVSEGLLLALSSFFVLLAIEIAKQLVARPRPYAVFSDIARRDTLTHGGFGFPSGHATIAVFLACYLATLLPRRHRPWLLLGVFLIGLSRLYLGMHNLLDVIGGACLGGAIGLLVYGPKLLAKK